MIDMLVFRYFFSEVSKVKLYTFEISKLRNISSSCVSISKILHNYTESFIIEVNKTRQDLNIAKLLTPYDLH